MSYFTNREKATVWWFDNDANASDGLVKITEEEAMSIAQPQPTTEQQAATIRAERDSRLAETDLIIIRCAEAGEPVPDKWKAYRQALRDVPEQAGFPDNVEWPTCPSESMMLDSQAS